MNIQEFVTELRFKGVELLPFEGKLRIDAPRGVLTENDRALIQQHKADIFENRQRYVLIRLRLAAALEQARASSLYDLSTQTAEAATAEASLETAIYQFVLGDGSLEDVQSAFRQWLAKVKVTTARPARPGTAELFQL